MQTQKTKILVAYYSRTGNTRAVAQDLAAELGADVEEMVDTKGRRGIFGWLGAGKDASQKKTTVIGPLAKDPAAYDLVILGTPVWAGTMASAVRTYIMQNRDKLKKVAFFCTMGASGQDKTFAAMAELCEKKPLATMSVKAEEVKIRQYQTQIRTFASQLVK
jgi:flavodoxin